MSAFDTFPDPQSARRFPEPAAALRLIKPITWFPPMWAYLCGVVSSGASAEGKIGLVILGVVLAGPVVCGIVCVLVLQRLWLAFAEAMGSDIGHFGYHHSTPGAEFLNGESTSATASDVRKLVLQLGGSMTEPGSSTGLPFTSYTGRSLLEVCTRLLELR